MDQKYQSFSWYPPMKAPNIQSEDSHSSPTLNNMNEEPSAMRNPQLKNSDAIVLHYADYENSKLDVSGDQETQEEDPDLSFHKKGSSHQTLKNFDNEKPNLNLLEKNSIRQTLTPFNQFSAVNDGLKNLGRLNLLRNVKSSTGQYDPNLNFFKKDSERQTLLSTEVLHIVDSNRESARQNSLNGNAASQHELNRNSFKDFKRNPTYGQHFFNIYAHQNSLNPNKTSDEYGNVLNFQKKDSSRQSLMDTNDGNRSIKQSKRQSPPTSAEIENLFELEDADAEKHTTQQYGRTTPDERDYEVADDDDVPNTTPKIEAPVSSKDLKVKRDELSPAEYGKISKALDSELNKLLGSNESNPCSNCQVLKIENQELKTQVETLEEDTRDLMPAYPCDRWFRNNRTCWLDRNIGDTVTFVLTFGGVQRDAQVQWRQEFHLLKSNKRRIYSLDPEKPLWNIVIGSHGHEFRLSPITETDIDSNSFSAIAISAVTQTTSTLAQHKVNFRIKVIPLDLGLIYMGEILTLNMRSLTLPRKAVILKWFMEKDGEKSSLPSNMKQVNAGQMLVISELRPGQGGVLACSVFTNLGFFATKQRYLINISSTMPDEFLSTPRSFKNDRKKRNLEEWGPDIMNRNHEQEESRNYNPYEERPNLYQTQNLQVENDPVNYQNQQDQSMGTHNNFGSYEQSNDMQPSGYEYGAVLGGVPDNGRLDTDEQNGNFQQDVYFQNAGKNLADFMNAHSNFGSYEQPNDMQPSGYEYGAVLGGVPDNGRLDTNEQNGNFQQDVYFQNAGKNLADFMNAHSNFGSYEQSNDVPPSGYESPTVTEANNKWLNRNEQNVNFQQDGNNQGEYIGTYNNFGSNDNPPSGYESPVVSNNRWLDKNEYGDFQQDRNNQKESIDTYNNFGSYQQFNNNPYSANIAGYESPVVANNNARITNLANTNIAQSSLLNSNAENSNLRTSPKVVEIERTRERIIPENSLRDIALPKGISNSHKSNIRNNNFYLSKPGNNNVKTSLHITKNEPTKKLNDRIDSNKRILTQEDKKNIYETNNIKNINIEVERLRNKDHRTNQHIPETKEAKRPMDYNKKVPTLENKKSYFETSNIRNIGLGNNNPKARVNVPEKRPNTNQYSQKESTRKVITQVEKVSNSKKSNLDSGGLRNSNIRYNNPRINSNVPGIGPTRNQNRPQDSRRRMNRSNDNERFRGSNVNRNNIQNIRQQMNRRLDMLDAKAEDGISKLMTSCTSNLHCAPAAFCVKGSGFCRCRLGYQGNGFFCWAEVHLINPEVKRKIWPADNVRRQF